MVIFISLMLIVLTATGQIFLKLGANKNRVVSFINGYIIFGYILFFLTIILSYYLMKIVPLKYFTVIMSLNYIAVMVLAKLFLGENIHKNKLIGTALISIGIFVFLMK